MLETGLKFRRVEDCTQSVIGPNRPCVVDKVECRKLPALIRIYKETMHKVGVGTDGPHPQIIFL